MVPGEIAGVLGLETLETAAARTEVRRRFARNDRKRFLSPLGAESQVHGIGKRPGEVRVQTDLLLLQVAHIEVPLRGVAVGTESQTLVDGVVQYEVDFVVTVAGAEVVAHCHWQNPP